MGSCLSMEDSTDAERVGSGEGGRISMEDVLHPERCPRSYCLSPRRAPAAEEPAAAGGALGE